MHGRQILAAYGVSFPVIPGKMLKVYDWHGEGGSVAAEVMPQGAKEPEWSTLDGRLEGLMAKVRKQYGLSPVAVTPTGEEGGDL